MRKYLGLVVLCGAAAIAACSAADDETTAPDEPVSEQQAAITGQCGWYTFGHPCDPDGATGPKLECQGVCWLGTNASPACVDPASVGITSMDGRVCGTAGGSSCEYTCLQGACTKITASEGTAC